MARLIELPLWFVALGMVASAAIGGGLCMAIDCLIEARGRRQ